MMTLEEFRATGRDVDDLGIPTNDYNLDGRPGRVYCDVLSIERPDDQWPLRERRDCEAKGGWYLVISNAEYCGTLAELEPVLYEFACDEGYCK